MSHSLPERFLVQGRSMPSIGFGTFQGNGDNSTVRDAVSNALKAGYRHIDTASAYGNEKEVGNAIKESGIPRGDIFVTTKLAQTWHDPRDVEEALDRSLKELQLEYVDLYLMHFPHAYVAGPDHTTVRHANNKPKIDHDLSRAYPSTWKALEQLVAKGKSRLIGVSNFNIIKLKRLLETARIPPAVNQVELHPYLPQTHLLAFCSKHGIHVTAHQPLGGNPVAAVNPNANRSGPLADTEIVKIADEIQVSPAQVLLAWAIHRQTSVIPKTIHPPRMMENFSLSSLSPETIKRIDKVAAVHGEVRFLDPSAHIGFDIFSEEGDEPV